MFVTKWTLWNIKYTTYNMPEEVQGVCNIQYTAVCMQYKIHTTQNVTIPFASCDRVLLVTP